MTDIYKEVLCQFIQAGKLTLQEVEDMKGYLESTSIERSRQTPTWAAAEALCQRLHDGITANSYRAFKMNVTNISAMERLLRIDQVSEPEARDIIEWCLAHEFWASVILSPVKFRKHYATMSARKVEERNKRERDSAKEKHPTAAGFQPKVVSDEELYARKRQREAESVPMPSGFKRVLGLVK